MAIVGMAFGAAMSSSPWERFWNGDEDVATPFHAGPSHDVPRLRLHPAGASTTEELAVG